MTRLVQGAIGLVLVGLVLSDVFHSVVLPRATRRTLRVGPMIGATLLRGGLAVFRNRQRLGVLGPLLIVTELLIWVAVLILGFALLLEASNGLEPHRHFGDTLYAAASVFVTTGLSGQEAQNGLARIVVALAGLSGLAVVTLVVTFLLSVQSALQRREALVLRLRARVGPAPSAVALLEGLARLGQDRSQSLSLFFADWESWAADVLLTHRAFPILLYFRSTDEDCGWMASLGAVLDAAALVSILAHEDAGEHALVCHRMGSRLVADLARQMQIKAEFQPNLDQAAFEQAVHRLGEAGYRTKEPAESTWPRFEELRSQHAPPLDALAVRFGEGQASW